MGANGNHAWYHGHVHNQRRQTSVTSSLQRRNGQVHTIHTKGLRRRHRRTGNLTRITRTHRRHMNRRQRRRKNRPTNRRRRPQIRYLGIRRRRTTTRQRHTLRRYSRNRRTVVTRRRLVQLQVIRLLAVLTQRYNLRYCNRGRQSRRRQRGHMRQDRLQTRVLRERRDHTLRLSKDYGDHHRQVNIITRRIFSNIRVTTIRHIKGHTVRQERHNTHLDRTFNNKVRRHTGVNRLLTYQLHNTIRVSRHTLRVNNHTTRYNNHTTSQVKGIIRLQLRLTIRVNFSTISKNLHLLNGLTRTLTINYNITRFHISVINTNIR